MKKACIFVDGENFRFSLTDLFTKHPYQFKQQDYLPNANWYEFFKWVALEQDCELLRTYWYVTGQIDYRPHKIPHPFNDQQLIYLKSQYYRDRLNGKTNKEYESELITIKREVLANKENMEKRSKGWRYIQDTIEQKNQQIEFRRIGTIPYNFVTRKFGIEKGVDTQLATDLITLSDIYDVAIIISGDADYIPPVQAIKFRGKLAYSISFLAQDGRKLPGGAQRLDRIVDKICEIPCDELGKKLSIPCK